MEVLRTLVVANDPLARAGLASLLAAEPGLLVAGQSESTPAALAAAVAAFLPEVVVWDLGWQPETQLEALNQLVDERELTVVALLPSPALVGAARAAGARGLLSRNTTGAQLAAAAQAVVQKLAVLEETFVALPITASRAEELAEPLTPRELEVLAALAEGLSNKQIARQLEISEHTAKFHINAILGKLGVQSRTEAVVRATRAGLILL